MIYVHACTHTLHKDKQHAVPGGLSSLQRVLQAQSLFMETEGTKIVIDVASDKLYCARLILVDCFVMHVPNCA